MKIILASNSNTRKKILDSLNIKYDVIVSDKEEIANDSDPRKYVEELSKIKANCVSEKTECNDVIIIAADSIIYKDGKIYQKPKSIEEAMENLREFSNCKNQGITGVTIIDMSNRRNVTFSCVTDVYFKRICEEDIKWYVKHEKDLLKKAGYSLEGTISLFVEKIEGDFYNVLGLPLGMLYTKLNELGYRLDDFEC